MANTNRPFGLKPVRTLHGAPWTGQVRNYYVPSTYATALFIGDPVIWTGTSNTAAFMDYGIATLAEVNIATVGSGNKITGVVTGIEMITRESTIYRPASVEMIVKVCDAPGVIFQIQDDGGGALGAVTVGLDAVLVAGTGSTITGMSAYALDGGTSTAPAANAAYQLKILNAANIPGNDATSDYAVWEVLINIPSYANGVAGV